MSLFTVSLKSNLIFSFLKRCRNKEGCHINRFQILYNTCNCVRISTFNNFYNISHTIGWSHTIIIVPIILQWLTQSSTCLNTKHIRSSIKILLHINTHWSVRSTIIPCSGTLEMTKVSTSLTSIFPESTTGREAVPITPSIGFLHFSFPFAKFYINLR